MLDSFKPEKDKKFLDERRWDLIYDGTYIRNYEGEDETDPDADMTKHYGEILLQFEQLLNLTAMLYQREAEQEKTESKRIKNLITALKKSLFGICDVHERTTSSKDMARIKEKGLDAEFNRNKFLFHEKFLKSLMQRPLNLQRANIFTSNYDLAFEYAFDNLGIKYIDGFSGFHHRYFKPETFNYDIFYPGSTTAGKVQRIEKVVRYFKLHGSISWVSDGQRTPSNIYGIEEMPIELIKRKAEDEKDVDFDYGNFLTESNRYLSATMIGTIENGKYIQGVYNYPILDNPVWYVTRKDLDIIFDQKEEGDDIDFKDDFYLPIGKSPAFPDYQVKINPDRMFGKHVAILGNTGSGKSCTLTSILQSLFQYDYNGQKLQSAHVVILIRMVNIKRLST